MYCCRERLGVKTRRISVMKIFFNVSKWSDLIPFVVQKAKE